MKTNLTKRSIELMEGQPGKVLRVRDGDSRLFLRIDRRSIKPIKAFYFEREFHGAKLRIKIGDYPTWTPERAKVEAKRLDVLCDSGQDPRDLRKQAAAEAEARRRQQRAGSITLQEVWQAYLDARQRDIRPLKPLTVRDYRKHMAKTLASWADMPISRITGEDVVIRYGELVKEVGAAQALQAVRSLGAVLNWAIANREYAGALRSNPVVALKNKTHKIRPRSRSLERGQIAAWWSAVESIRNPFARTYLRLLLLTGMRREEALSLRWSDIDFRWNTCTIHDSKNGEDRVIPLTVYVRDQLMALPRLNEWVFYSQTSVCGRMREPAKHIARIAAITGLHIPSHDLRRSFGGLVEWIELPDGAVKQLLGHKPGGDVTQAHYKPRPLDLLRSMLQRYENFILAEAGQHGTVSTPAPDLKLAAG